MSKGSIRISLCLFTLAAAVTAQTFRGSISGTITDTTGAAIPDASVKALSVSTGLLRETVASASGDFTIPDLPLGF